MARRPKSEQEVADNIESLAAAINKPSEAKDALISVISNVRDALERFGVNGWAEIYGFALNYYNWYCTEDLQYWDERALTHLKEHLDAVYETYKNL